MEQANQPTPDADVIDLSSLEADLAFFAARLSLAEAAPRSVYQQAQIKTYRTLGRILGDTAADIRKRRGR